MFPLLGASLLLLLWLLGGGPVAPSNGEGGDVCEADADLELSSVSSEMERTRKVLISFRNNVWSQ